MSGPTNCGAPRQQDSPRDRKQQTPYIHVVIYMYHMCVTIYVTIHITVYMHGNKSLIHRTTQVNLKGIMLRERGETQKKVPSCLSPFIGRSGKGSAYQGLESLRRGMRTFWEVMEMFCIPTVVAVTQNLSKLIILKRVNFTIYKFYLKLKKKKKTRTEENGGGWERGGRQRERTGAWGREWA